MREKKVSNYYNRDLKTNNEFSECTRSKRNTKEFFLLA